MKDGNMLMISNNNVIHVGILLVPTFSNRHDHHEQLPIGFVTLANTDACVSTLRPLIHKQFPTLSFQYNFLTRNSWPIQKDQEAEILISAVITDNKEVLIKKKCENRCVGIRSNCGMAYGFVFIDLNASLSLLRTEIQNQLQQSCNDLCSKYKFLVSLDWPVTEEQESQLFVLDAISNSEVIIDLPTSKKRKNTGHASGANPSKSSNRPTTLSLANDKLSTQRSISAGSSGQSADNSSKNRVFISYVRAEAKDHAIELKRVLFDNGMSVFLDVDDIQAGVDWMDSLNNAINECHIFVALVTDTYGKTKWTNREVKAADLNNKVILPISFLQEWPPTCLAIQFATTQFIPWKDEKDIQEEISQGEESRALNINFWDKHHVNKACQKIIDKYEEIFNAAATPQTPDQSELNRQFSTLNESSEHRSQASFHVRENHLIVISVHPKQKQVAHDIRLLLGEDNYEVWCSTDTNDLVEQNGGINGNHSPLTPLPITPTNNKSQTLFASAIASAGTEFNDSAHAFGLHARRNLKNLTWSPSIEGLSFSQLSDCSAGSSMSPDTAKHMQIFRSRVQKASLVLLLLSSEYEQSSTSQKQAYYCEHRKKILGITIGSETLRPWMTSLLDNVKIVPYDITNLKEAVQSLMQPKGSAVPADRAKEEEMAAMVQKTITQLEQPLSNCVYIAGSSKFYNQKSESICRAIGVELANLEMVVLVTGGFYGVGDSVGRNFCEERQILRKQERIFHILPEKDCPKKYGLKAKLDDDGNFLRVPYGATIFMGKNVREREALVARLFSLCILVEGGPGAAHEAEQFIWNDKIVIPIMVTGGAANKMFNIPSKVFVCPPGVSPNDWSILSNEEMTADDIAAAVKRIVCSLHQSSHMIRPKNSKKLYRRKQRYLLSRSNTINN